MRLPGFIMEPFEERYLSIQVPKELLDYIDRRIEQALLTLSAALLPNHPNPFTIPGAMSASC